MPAVRVGITRPIPGFEKNRPAAIVAVDNLEAAEEIQTCSFKSDNETPEAALIAKTDAIYLEAAMRKLPPLFREVVVLREMEDLSYRIVNSDGYNIIQWIDDGVAYWAVSDMAESSRNS